MISEYIQNKIVLLLNDIEQNLYGFYRVEWLVEDGGTRILHVFSKTRNIENRVEELTASHTRYYAKKYTLSKLILTEKQNKNKIKITNGQEVC